MKPGKQAILAFLILALATIPLSCEKKKTATMNDRSLIPLPVTVEPDRGVFEVSRRTNIFVDRDSEEMLRNGQFLAALLSPVTGEMAEVQVVSGDMPGRSIFLALTDDESWKKEQYALDISHDLVRLSARDPEGIFRGIQTIRQLLPAEVESGTKSEVPWFIPCGKITDFPEYAYRGMMLDVSRHFFGVEEVKRVIDLISAYKMNVLHLHLSDDQGWRIEIKSRPLLTTIGGSTQVGGGEGGYYTQEEFAGIVSYAADRFITIVPEVEMPGHSNAALASYPELNCDGQARELYMGTEVGFSTLCTTKEETYLFIDDVVRELSQMSPGPYLHIGGDESLVTEKEDYIPFLNRVQDIVEKYGKRMVGWEEIAQADLDAATIVQHWASREHAIEAVHKGASLIMSPATKIYLDMQYDSTTPLGLDWAAYIEADSAYLWDPANMIDGIGRSDILGIEAPLWTETIVEMDDIEYMVFPRLAGYAEIGWTAPASRAWPEYRKRLGAHAERFHAMGIGYYRSPLIDWEE